MGNPLLNTLSVINKWCVVFEKILLCTLLFTTIFLAFGQIVSRNLFSMGYVWVDQVLRICVLWIAFTGASLASEYKGHIKIDVMYNIINSQGTKAAIEIIAQILTMIICALLFTASVQYIMMISTDPRASLIATIPDWYYRGIIPYCFLIMTIRCFIHALKLFNKRKRLKKI